MTKTAAGTYWTESQRSFRGLISVPELLTPTQVAKTTKYRKLNGRKCGCVPREWIPTSGRAATV